MARTAPVPNIPPIPGMCPSLAVMGGGGGSGGGSGNGAGSGRNGTGPNGEGGADGTDGDGTAAGDCGAGEGGSCNSCSSTMVAGDPVDVGSGAVLTSPVEDVSLPGPLPLVINRRYSTSRRRQDLGMGFGWTFTLAWAVTLRRDKIDVVGGDGSEYVFPKLEVGQSVLNEGIELSRSPRGFELKIANKRWWFEGDVVVGKPTRLTKVLDRNGNQLTIAYRDDGRGSVLDSLVDSVGRIVKVDVDDNGRVVALKMKNAQSNGRWHVFAQYTYSPTGHLTEVRNAVGATWTYEYDEQNRLIQQLGPTGVRFFYIYDSESRCVETWGEVDEDTSTYLAPSVSTTLSDGSPAKGIYHSRIDYFEDYREVVDGRRMRRADVATANLLAKTVAGGNVTTREFDATGRLRSMTDGVGAVTRFERDSHGRILREIDPLGMATIYRRVNGLPVEVADDLGVVFRAEYDASGNLLVHEGARGERSTFVCDARGMLESRGYPNGGEERYIYDAYYNLVARTDSDGAVWRYEYDFLGRATAQIDPLGARTLIQHDASGRVTAVRYATGAQEQRFYNLADDLTEYVAADGRRFQFSYLHHRVTKATAPDGTALRYLHDRELFLTEIQNENDESRCLRRNDDGVVTQVTSFDGRTTTYQLDEMNRVVRYRDASNRTTVFTRDIAGRVVAVEYDNGNSVAFSYNKRNELVGVVGDGYRIEYERDPAGLVRRETRHEGDDESWIEYEYDSMRRPSLIRTSLGHVQRLTRDVEGRTQTHEFDDETTVFDYEPLGRESVRRFGRDVELRNEYAQGLGGPTRRWCRTSTAPRGHGIEPEWVGGLPDNVTAAKQYQYSQDGSNIVSAWDQRRGERAYRYDDRERLLAVDATDAAFEETFTHDRAGSVSTKGHARLGPGNRMLQSGNCAYDWNADGELTAKHVTTDDGTESWRYSWHNGWLSEVETPQGSKVRFRYDAFARRLGKDVIEVTADGKERLASRTKYLWDRRRIVQEIVETSAVSGDPVVEEITYVYDGRDQPMAQRKRLVNEAEDGPWSWFVNDPFGTPEDLVDENGAVVGGLNVAAYGAAEQSGPVETTLRQPGQYEDAETGLFYNRYRYYDPDLGSYISQDPAGKISKFNLYQYATNPVSGSDFFGLVHYALGEFRPNGPDDDTGAIQLNGGEVIDASFDDGSRDDFRARSGQDVADPGNYFRNLNERDSSGTLAYRSSDTEAKAIRELDQLPAGERRGGHLILVGELPPCTSCQRRMREFGERNGATVEYHWTGRRTRSGSRWYRRPSTQPWTHPPT